MKSIFLQKSLVNLNQGPTGKSRQRGTLRSQYIQSQKKNIKQTWNPVRYFIENLALTFPSYGSNNICPKSGANRSNYIEMHNK